MPVILQISSVAAEDRSQRFPVSLDEALTPNEQMHALLPTHDTGPGQHYFNRGSQHTSCPGLRACSSLTVAYMECI